MVGILEKIAERRNLVQDKGKRNVTDRTEWEQSCKMKVDAIFMQEDLEA